jgi:multiple sugar transport system permease protein
VIVTVLGFPPVAWLVKPWLSLSIVVLTDVWLQTPFYVIIILAALETLPREPFEAARVDGANPWQIFRNVTLPLLRPVLLVAIVIRSIDAFRVFDTVWTITKGEPGRATEVFSIYAYKEAFVFLNLDRGAAASMIGAVIIMMVGIVLYWGLRRVTEVSR